VKRTGSRRKAEAEVEVEFLSGISVEPHDDDSVQS
jgi:hypothetical protein